jgi:hypothetical protein
VAGAAETTALAGHGFAHDWQPAGHVTTASVGAAPDVFAPAGHGFSHDSQPAGQVTAVVQSVPATDAAGAVTAGGNAEDADHEPPPWAAVWVWKSEREIKASMH